MPEAYAFVEGNRAEPGKQETDGSISRRWYALRVRPRHEDKVSEQLEAKKCEVFLPRYSERRKWADRWKVLTLPLFPGYVFCHFDAGDRSRILATAGVIDLVRRGAEPAPIEDHEIDAIRRVVNSELKAEPYPTLACGQRVMVSGGPLDGVTGVLVQMRTSYRLVISVELLQRSVQVEIERERVLPCEARAAGIRD